MQPPRVLVVDDDAHLRRLVHDNLALEGMAVRTAADVAEAERIVAEWLPDLVVLDIMLPERSGLEFCTQLSQRQPPIPVLFLSARGTPEDKVLGLAAGAVDYLAKPFDPAELVARCRAALRTQEHARARARQELEEFKSEVLALLGHELRTPLSLVLGYAELLQARGEQLSHRHLETFVREIAAGSQRLARVLEDVLLLASPAGPRRAVDLRTVLDEAVADAADAFGTARVTLAYQRPPAPLLLDAAWPLLLRQAVRHLLENAAAFAPAGSEVQLRVATAGAQVAITVADQGPGIPPEEQPHVFERFYQVSRGPGRRHGGLGLGLAIVRRAADDHGGAVTLDSAPGAGTRVTLRLPLAPRAAPTS
jgi:signal transduction histidine kinase